MFAEFTDRSVIDTQVCKRFQFSMATAAGGKWLGQYFQLICSILLEQIEKLKIIDAIQNYTKIAQNCKKKKKKLI